MARTLLEGAHPTPPIPGAVNRNLPNRALPNRVFPDRTLPSRTPPARTLPARTLPGRAPLGRVALGRASPGGTPPNGTPPARTPLGRASRARRALTIALSAAALLGSAGCGIRGTSVPVDAGPAPSRVSCQVPDDRTPPLDSPQEVAADVYLVCSTQIVPVGRGVRYPDSRLEDDRLRIARTLLAELRAQPSGPETAGGFSTEVPDGLEVGGRRAGDPEHALRLSREPGEVPPYGLAQLVCTYAGTPAVGGSGSVLLGGPGDEPPRSFRCTPGLRAQPEAVQSPGVGLE